VHSIRLRKLITLIKTQITYVPVQGSFFYRSSFSAAELDDTCRERPRVDFPRDPSIYNHCECTSVRWQDRKEVVEIK